MKTKLIAALLLLTLFGTLYNCYLEASYETLKETNKQIINQQEIVLQTAYNKLNNIR